MAFQAKLTTKFDKYSVEDTIIELKNTVDKEQLNHTIRSLLVQLGKFEKDELSALSFEFLVGGRFLQLSVEKHFELYSDEINVEELLSEKLVEIEYLVALEAPEPLADVPHDDWVSCVDANQDYIITGSYDNSVRIFSIKDRKSQITIDAAHEKPVTRVKWITCSSLKGTNELYFISCGHDEVSILRSFNTKTRQVKVISVFGGHNRSVNCVDSLDNLIATGSFDKTLRIWSLTSEQNGDHEEHSGEGEGDDEDEDGGDVDPKKRQKTTSKKTNAQQRKKAMMTLTGHQESVTGVRWLDSGEEFNSLATCSMDRTICIWDVEVGECKRKMLSAKPLLGIDYSKSKNLILSASCDRHVRIWDARAPDNATAKIAYTSHNAWISGVAFGSDTDNFVSAGYDNLVKMWDIRSPKACLYDLIGHHDKVLAVNWANPAYVLSGSADGTLKVFATK